MFTNFIQTIQGALQFDFFLRALEIGTLLAIICSYLGTYVVVRKEVMIAHSIANIAFLGATLGIMAGISINISILVSAIIGVLIITFLQNTNFFSRGSVIEFTAQIAMGGAIVATSLLTGYKIDVMQFLFGDILAISQQEVWFSVILSGLVIIALVALKKPLTQIVINQDLAKASGTSILAANMIYMLLIAITVAVTIKIIGVILLAAFMVIPPNIAKLISPSLKSMKIWAIAFGVIGSIIGLFGAYVFDVPSGAMIVLTLGLILILVTSAVKIKGLAAS